MARYFLKTLWRNLVRNQVYSLLNIAGLAIGISSCLLIYLYVQDELSYDRQFGKANRIYKIASSFTMQGVEQRTGASPFPLAAALKNEFPQVEEVVRVRPTGKQTYRSSEKMLYLENVYFADSNFFRVFDFDMLHGNPEKALAAPNTVVLTKEFAEKFFGSSEAALDKILQTDRRTYQVTGVVENPEQTHLKFTALHSMNTLTQEQLQAYNDEWFSLNIYTYALLKSKAQEAEFTAQVTGLCDKLVNPRLQENGLNFRLELFPQKLTGIHLGSDLDNELSASGNRSYLYIFSMVAVFILLIACINYMNLATARSVKRSREVGLLKVVGAHRKQLVLQFFGEALLVALLAAILGLMLVELLLPVFNQITEKNLAHGTLFTAPVLGFVLAVVAVVALLAGSYPAIYLSAFNPANVLRADSHPSGSGTLLRKGLVVAQFSISVALIICTLVVVRQMQYLKNTDLGFTKEQVVLLSVPPGDTSVVNHLETLKQELLQNPRITQVAGSAQIPGDQRLSTQFYIIPNRGQREEHSLSSMWVDYGFVDLLGIKVVQGRTFRRDFPSDDSTILINQSTARLLGWDEPVGRKFLVGGQRAMTVIGVLEDFHFKSLHQRIEPLVVLPASKWVRQLAIKVSPEDLASTIGFIEQKWNGFTPKHPADYVFLDENFNKQYRSEEKMLVVFGYFAGLTILIACLGLFGLSAYSAEQRTKEIGIRKVLGSTVAGIVVLLTRDFARLVLLALLIASPLAWWGMHKWLEDFAYRTEIGIGVFVIAGAGAFIVALLTVGTQAAKAAMLDPVKALKTV